MKISKRVNKKAAAPKTRKTARRTVKAATVLQPVSLPSPNPQPWIQGKGLYLLLGCWALMSLGLLTYPCFQWLAPWTSGWPIQKPFWLIAALWAVLAWLFHSMPETNPNRTDISSWAGRVWLWISMGAVTAFCFYRGVDPIAAYWSDEALEILTPRGIVDSGNFANTFVTPYAGWEPLYSAVAQFFWRIFPQAPCLMIQRVIGLSFFLVTLWLIYLVGKELRSRRFAVLAVLLAALSKPLLIRAISGMRILTITVAVSLALLFFLRLIRKPNLSHFLQWGLAVGFGAYTYSPFRTFVGLFILAGLAWVLASKKDPRPQGSSKIFLWLTVFLFAGYFLYANNGFSDTNPLFRWVNAGGPWPSALLLAASLGAGLWALRGKISPANSWVMGWMASWICLILTHPFTISSSGPGRFFGPVLTFLTLGFAYRASKKCGMGFLENFVFLETAFVDVVYFLYHGRFLPPSNLIAWFSEYAETLLPALLLLANYLLVLVVLFRKTRFDVPKWLGWVLGVWATILLTFPIMTNPIIVARLRHLGGQSQSFLNGNFIQETFHRFVAIFQFPFSCLEDQLDFCIPGDCLFNFTEIVIIGLGLAYIVGKPNWKKTFLLILSALGFAIYFLSAGRHSGRTNGGVVPFLLIGALGLDEVLGHLSEISTKRILYRFACILLVVWCVWTFNKNISRIYDQWMDVCFFKNTLVQKAALADQAQGRRVYVCTSLSGDPTAPLMENHPVFLWREHNVLFLEPGEKIPDVVVYYDPESRSSIETLAKTYPEAQWSDLKAPFQQQSDGFMAKRCLIPSDVVAKDSRQLEIHQVSAPFWKRLYNSTSFGFTFGMVDYEDRVADIHTEPLVRVIHSGEAYRYTTILNISREGKYILTLTSPDHVVLRMDDRRLINIYIPHTEHIWLSPKETIQKTVFLTAGPHPLEVTANIDRDDKLPELTMRPKGDPPNQAKSLWDHLNF